MPVLPETEIIAKARAGDVQAFRILVEKHQAFAYSLSYRFLGNASDAEDVTQECFIRLWKNLPRYRAEVKMTTWLYKIITNLCLDALKSSHHRQSKRSANLESAETGQGSTATDQGIIQEELRDAIVKMAERLTPKQKAVFILRDLEDLSMDEVEDVLSMSPGNIKSNLYYARVSMSNMLRKYYQEEKPL